MRKHLRIPIRNFCMSISKAKKRGDKTPSFLCNLRIDKNAEMRQDGPGR